MEDLLLNVVKEASGQKLALIRKAAQDAHDMLCLQNNLHRTPSHELRAACFLPFRLSLESKRSKLVSHALTGLHKIVRDERFQAGSEPEDDSLWLPAQLLYATTSMLTHSEDTQVHILRVLLSLACGTCWALNGRLVMLILGRCGEACDVGTQPVRAAAQAAASQTVRAFTTFLDEECQEILTQQQKHKPGTPSDGMLKTSAVACLNEAIPVMQYICSRLEESKTCPKTNETTVFLLECLLTLVSTLPRIVHTNAHFTTFLWQRFCPALIALLGAPGEPSAHTLSSQQAKTVYSIGIQLVRLVGCVGTLRPVLEALFHRMVLLPAAPKRLEPLRSLRELLRSPERLVDLILLPECGDKPSSSDDMAIIRLIMDSIEESALCNDTPVMLASVECVVAMLSSLDALCKGEGITPEAATLTNNRYVSLEQADYKGPLTYQSLARLPKPYRDVVANLRYASDSDSSGIDGGPGDNNEDGGTESDDSGATEGPEAANESDDSIMDDESFLTSHELTKIQKLPKYLHVGRTGIDECNVDVERHNAKHFVKTVQNILLPNLLSLRSSIQVDEVLQEFASKCCEHNSAQNTTVSTIMNADGIYLATYSALLLNLKLMQLGYYQKDNKTNVPMTEDEFVDEVHGSGVLVYLSATWLSELYQHVLATSLLEDSGYDPNSGQQYALINLLTDVGGLNNNKFLSDWQKLERVQGPQNIDLTLESQAGIKLSRRVLTCCWDSMVTVLSGALAETSVSALGSLGGRASKLGLLIPRRARRIQGKKKVRDNLIASSLDGLHKAASLSNILKLQSRGSSILALLSSSACQSSATKLHAAHALSLDVLLSKGLALGSHSADCWPHVFAACVHVARLEHALFSKAGNAQMLMVAQNANTVVTSTTERLNLSFGMSKQDEETCVDVYSFLQSPSYSYSSQKSNLTQAMETTIATIVNKSGAHNTSHGILSNVDAAKVCCVLSQQVDALFHESALKLNLPVLCQFLEELCNASQRQLFAHTEESAVKTNKWWRRTSLAGSGKDSTTSKGGSQLTTSLLLHRIGDVTLKCISAGRPLIHTMHVWSLVGPHLMEAACHKDRAVSKKAITCIHDAVTALLNEQLELPHFHFNEALFKPFENLLCLELCDSDVQDQIVSCLCEFVEANRTEIRSGWRPLFGTLRVANSNVGNNAAAILEVFQVFLSTDNTLVFANAALDYILCLLTHIRGADAPAAITAEQPETPPTPPQTIAGKRSAENLFYFLPNTEKSTGFFDVLETRTASPEKLQRQLSNGKNVDLCIESLRYLENCASILAAMYNMPQCPTFNMAHRIQIDTQPQLVDAVIQDIDVVFFNNESPTADISYKLLATIDDLEMCVAHNLTLMKMDRPSGVLRIWYILLEGLASATIICARRNQPHALETLFKLLRDLMTCPGINFGLYCINHLLLPMVQNWLRQNAQTHKNWDSVGPNFKQCCGMASELVVEYLFKLQSIDEAAQKLDLPETENPAATLALKQLLLILVECVIQPNETIARLGTSCMRHIILSSGHIFTAAQWMITVTAFHRACAISLNHLQQLTLAFKTDSDSFYGDLAVVKVAARKDCTINDNLRLNQLCQQVFLLAAQREHAPNHCTHQPEGSTNQRTECKACELTNRDDSSTGQIIIDDRSYIFLLYPLEMPATYNPELYTVRVPFRNLIVGILAHQMLVQTIASVLLQNLTYITPIALIVQMTNNHTLTGRLRNFSLEHYHVILKCLELSHSYAAAFDARPGLKFLVQKVGNLEKAANLYTQNNTSEIVQIIILIELCLHQIESATLSTTDLQMMLDEPVNEQAPRQENDYIPIFLRKLKDLWEHLCNSYLTLSLQIPDVDVEEVSTETPTINLPEQEDVPSTPTESVPEVEETVPPFKLSDFKNEDTTIDTTKDSDEITPEIESIGDPTPEESHVETNDQQDDTEVQETHEERVPAETERQVEVMMEKYRNRKTIHSTPTPRTNPFTSTQNYVPKAQPVPAEIQQQRALNIRKDFEYYKSTRLNTLSACLELLRSIPPARLASLSPVFLSGVRNLLSASGENIKQDANALWQVLAPEGQLDEDT